MQTAKLIGRTYEEKLLNDILTKTDKKSKLIWIYGNSGCGKTFFAKNKIGEIINKQPDVYSCYVNIEADEMTTVSLYEILTYFSWNEHSYNDERLLSVPAKASYSEFIRKSKFNKQAYNNLLSTLKNSLSLIPMYGDIIKSLISNENKNADFSNQQVEDLFYSYIKKITSKRKAIFIFDNYQFIDSKMRRRIEARFGNIQQNIYLGVTQ